jgi:hypothetical protein
MPSDAPAIGILSDDMGKPGAMLLPETPTVALGPRQLKATFSGVSMTAGKTVWIAIKHKVPGSITSGTVTPKAMSGTMTPQAFSPTQLSGPWTLAGNAVIVFNASSCM